MGCGAEVNDDQLWYMELSPCFRANAAFSLYGILKGEKDRGCSRKTFINSFMTSTGIEDFTNAMVAAGKSFTSAYNGGNGYPGGVTSSCAVISEQGQDNGGGAMLNDYYNSYGVACSSSGQYMSSFFKGAFCSDTELIGTKDDLDTFNEEISNIKCVPIYRSSGQRRAEDANGYDNSPLFLLVNSQTCSVAEYPKSCPDPFGKVKQYEKALALSTGQRHNKRNERIRLAVSWMLLLLGISALSVPAFISRRRKHKRKQGVEDDRSVKKRTLWQRFMHSMKKKQRPSSHYSGGTTNSGRNSTTSSITA